MIINPATTLSILTISMILVTWLTASSISQEKGRFCHKVAKRPILFSLWITAMIFVILSIAVTPM